MISDKLHEEIVSLYRDRADRAEYALAQAEARHATAYADLLAKYHAVVDKRVERELPDKAIDPQVDLIAQAAHETWGSQPHALAAVNRFIAEERRKQKDGVPDALSDAELMDRVLFGVSESDGVMF